MTDRPSRSILHFLQLAHAGRHEGCSSGEKAARELAEAFCRLAPTLDESASDGAAEFLCLARMDAGTCRALIAYFPSDPRTPST